MLHSCPSITIQKTWPSQKHGFCSNNTFSRVANHTVPRHQVNMQNFDRTIPTAFAQFLLGQFKVHFKSKIFELDFWFEFIQNILKKKFVGNLFLNPILSTYCRLVNRDYQLHHDQEANWVVLSLFLKLHKLKSAIGRQATVSSVKSNFSCDQIQRCQAGDENRRIKHFLFSSKFWHRELKNVAHFWH